MPAKFRVANVQIKALVYALQPRDEALSHFLPDPRLVDPVEICLVGSCLSLLAYWVEVDGQSADRHDGYLIRVWIFSATKDCKRIK